MKPDIDRAATCAMETLVKFQVTSAPIIPIPILKHIPDVMVQSFTEMSFQSGIDRNDLIGRFGTESQDAVTYVKEINGRLYYVILYNQRLPFYMIQRGLARELGHIVLGHDGSRSEEVRAIEAQVFAYHFLCPRPLIRAIQDSNVRFSIEVLGSTTGCYEMCLTGMRHTPGAHVPADLNRKVKVQFADYIMNFIDFQSFLQDKDVSTLADFGTYMDCYEE